jgi:glycosyltransferase involved in cell wall biosynthesis
MKLVSVGAFRSQMPSRVAGGAMAAKAGNRDFMPASRAMSGPRVAVVIPIFKQPSLVMEAIESVLRQGTNFDYRIVLVNDGCPYDETERVCRRYAQAYPERIRYVHRRNGGLSAARNTGVDYALGAWPTVAAIQMLDSDDRLGPLSLQTAYDTLQNHPEAQWSYPPCQRFGMTEDFVSVEGPWVVVELLGINYVMCASMVRRSVFESGLRYDEQMKIGYEDWEFWIHCVSKGLRGIHAPTVDFRYRQRAESMLSGCAWHHDSICGYIRAKHPSLYEPRRVIELEHEEIPRYAIYFTDTGRLSLTSDPTMEGRRISREELLPRLKRWQVRPKAERFPSLLVVTSEAFLRATNNGHCTPWLFWHLQNRLVDTDAKFVTVRLAQRLSRGFCLRTVDDALSLNLSGTNASLIMLRTTLLHSCLTDPNVAWLRDALNGEPGSAVDCTEVQLATTANPDEALPDAAQELIRLVEALGPDYRATPSIDVSGGKTVYRQTGEASEVTRLLLGSGPLLPKVMDRERIHIGYVIPICAFGGVERVSCNLARESRQRGWAPHLFLIGSDRVQLLEEFKNAFETISIVDDPAALAVDRLTGLLSTMDVVVNNNCSHVNVAYGALRRAGVRTFAQLHSVSVSSGRMPTGQPYETIKYEHTLNGVLVISEKLLRWCRSWGIPEEKLILARNAPSFAVDEDVVTTTMIDRRQRQSGSPLRALFLGRFDHEKGLRRLLALFRRTRREGPDTFWKIVGDRVTGAGGLEEEDFAFIQGSVRSSAWTVTDLCRLYSWADILVMPSHFEGVPLSILEAQSLGCVVLATDVGAIDEIIVPGETGFLFPNNLDTEELSRQMRDCMKMLYCDRGRLMTVANAAVEGRRRESWTGFFEPFAKKVEALCQGRRKGQA